MTMYHPTHIASTSFSSNTTTGGGVPASFDAFLYKPVDEGPLKLTIKLRIKLRQAAPGPFSMSRDADGKPYWTLPWNAGDWQRFVGGAQVEADLWNNKFWLLPPPTFSDYDVTFDAFPGKAYRPNIRCELQVDFNSNSPHKTIDVVNLNIALLRAQGRRLNSHTFRSHALLYDSLDTTPSVFPFGQGPGEPKKHSTIAHEIGHAMGLDHIGVLLKTPLCVYATKGDNRLLAAFDPNVQGGTNAVYCYGDFDGKAAYGNIMGGGDAFTVENARPWLWAMGLIRKQPSESFQWRATTSDPGPASVVRR